MEILGEFGHDVVCRGVLGELHRVEDFLLVSGSLYSDDSLQYILFERRYRLYYRERFTDDGWVILRVCCDTDANSVGDSFKSSEEVIFYTTLD